MARAQTLEDLAAFARDGHFGALATSRVERFLVQPARAVLGQPVTLSWVAENTRHVELWLGGAVQLRRVVPQQGRWTLRPEQIGTAVAELRCWAEDAGDSDPPACVETARLAVTAPPVTLQLAQKQLRGTPGATVVLAWGATGADRVELRRPLSGETLVVPESGSVALVLDCVDEVVELRATGADQGAVVRETCRLRPLVIGMTDISPELSVLTEPLEELLAWN